MAITMDLGAYEKLKTIKADEPISNELFNALIRTFQIEYLARKNYFQRIALHHNPIEVKNGLLNELNTYLLDIQGRDEMRDIDIENSAYGYVPTKINDIWKSDKRLKTLYNAVREYCLLRSKDFNTIAVHIAEYRAMVKLYRKISRSVRKDSFKKQVIKMPKNFETEIRETSGTKYLKIFLRHGLNHDAVSAHICRLPSVRKSNVTVQNSGKIDLTVYPAKAYDISETQEEVELTLDNYFKGNKVDPQFVEETVSAVSEKAYYQVIDYILMLGKNLESSKRLNERFDEERYRDYFIPYLNTISKNHSATGESFHSEGKTDILFMNEKGEPVLIAECKLWKGEKLLLEAVDQLLNTYVNWRDEKIALIVFNRDNKKFSDVIETATKAVAGHALCTNLLSKRADTSYSYIFRNPDDDKKIILLELILFNFA